ncbi:MAG TPA: hypothetical protein ENK28_13375 [Aliiroseovarius sp.]|nr:hypothetical protein [Aliiroseovarius sp.]
MKRLLLALVFVPGMANAEPWGTGVFAADPGMCVPGNIEQTRLNGAIEISGDAIIGYESSCAITVTREMSARVTYLSLTCAGEGESWDEERVLFRDEATIWMWRGAGLPIEYTPCGNFDDNADYVSAGGKSAQDKD